jgi:hypothetical protein
MKQQPNRTIRERIRAWWQGELQLDNDLSVFWVHYKRHWTSRVARLGAEFVRREWKWCVGLFLSVIGLLFAYQKL